MNILRVRSIKRFRHSVIDIDHKLITVDTKKDFDRQVGLGLNYPKNFKQLGRHFDRLPDPLSNQFRPKHDNLSLAEYANFSPALQMLIDLGVELPKDDNMDTNYKFKDNTRYSEKLLNSCNFNRDQP